MAVMIDTAVVVRNTGELFSACEVIRTFYKSNFSSTEVRENSESKRIQAALAESGIDEERVKTSLREGIIETVCPGSRKRNEHSLCQERNSA